VGREEVVVDLPVLVEGGGDGRKYSVPLIAGNGEHVQILSGVKLNGA
jgi:hypothetical protein